MTRKIFKKPALEGVNDLQYGGKIEKKVFMLSGLDCAHCAQKIEQAVNRITGVKNASLDFITKKLRLELDEPESFDLIKEQIGELVDKIEPGVQIIPVENITPKDEMERTAKKEYIRLGCGAVLFALAFIPYGNTNVNFSLFLVSYLLVGGKVLLRAGKNILRGQVFDENFLMTIATLGAFAIKEFPEGVAVMLFYQVGEFFQDRAVNKSRRSIKALLDIRPDYANLTIGEKINKVAPEEVKLGDIIIIKPGERVPLDGRVLEGQAMLDTSALTGESVPRKAKPEDDVLSGFINKDGILKVQVTKEYKESAIAKILDLVENAGSKKAPTENFITKFAQYYTPVVVIGALGIALIPPLFIEGAVFSEWIYRALVFLVISCPCALMISIPLGFFGGIGAASKKGILIKGGNYLEALNKIDSIVFDKTGTLTKGVFKVTMIRPEASFTKEEVLKYAAYAEFYSNHPIAQSIIKSYDQKINQDEIEGFHELSGYGTKVSYQGKEILAGNEKLMLQEKIPFQEIEEEGTKVYLAVQGQFAGAIMISDELKEDALWTIKRLKKAGIKKLVMLTGDNQKTGQKIGKELGLDQVYGELLPIQKVEILEKLVQEKTGKGVVVFVGDGLNDAPVLARADVGVAMGGLGSDAAIEASDIVLMTDEPAKLVQAIRIAGKTRRVVWQNIIFSVGVKLLVLILGAGGIATLWEAVFADVGVALIAVFNAMRLLK